MRPETISNTEMRFALGPCARMARMQMGFVHDHQGLRRQLRVERSGDPILERAGHRVLVFPSLRS